MRMVRGFYNEQNNTVNVICFDIPKAQDIELLLMRPSCFSKQDYILSLDCGKWENKLRTTPNSQGRMDALAIDDPVEYVRLMLSGEMQVWLDALDDLSVW